eukprot:2633485-Amphidinium_carterae.1
MPVAEEINPGLGAAPMTGTMVDTCVWGTVGFWECFVETGSAAIAADGIFASDSDSEDGYAAMDSLCHEPLVGPVVVC